MPEPATEYEIALAVIPAPAPPISPAEELMEQLIELGARFAPGTVNDVMEAIDSAMDRAGDQRGAEALAHISARLGDTAAGLALRRVMSNDQTPLRECARRAGVSHVALWKQERTVRRRLGLTATPLI